MASQEFLASFGVEIDEAGVTRLQKVLADNKVLAEELSAAFGAAASSVKAFAEEAGLLPDFSGRGITAEGASGFGYLSPGLDMTQAKKDLDAFIREAKKPIPLSGNGAGLTSAGQAAYSSIKSIFSTPIAIRTKVGGDSAGSGTGDGNTEGNAPRRMSAGGRFTKPTDVQVAEDGDAEYIIPVRKEDRAVPLLRQLIAELSPAAREQLGNSQFTMLNSAWGGLSAGGVGTAGITRDNRSVSAPVSIQVHSSGADAEQIGRSLYDTAERYLLRTLQSAFSS